VVGLSIAVHNAVAFYVYEDASMRYGTGLIFAGAAAAALALIGLGLRQPPPAPHPLSNREPAALLGRPLSGVTVVLDPGHGGADPGTTSGPVSEAALTYRTASELSASLQAQGAHVVYTVRSKFLDPALAATEPPLERPADAVMAATGDALRSRHSPRPLWQRAETGGAVWAAHLHQDPQAARDIFFLSLHFDQFQSPNVHGGVVCVDRRCSPVPALAKALAEQMVQGDLGRTGDFHGVSDLSGRDLGVLDPRYNPIPEKALLEVATLSNPQDALEAEDPTWRSEVVRRITLAITQTHQR
jgi:N-acetylmuramoyl-L-alanine amidase